MNSTLSCWPQSPGAALPIHVVGGGRTLAIIVTATFKQSATNPAFKPINPILSATQTAWRRKRDSNPRYGFPHRGFQDIPFLSVLNRVNQLQSEEGTPLRGQGLSFGNYWGDESALLRATRCQSSRTATLVIVFPSIQVLVPRLDHGRSLPRRPRP